MPPLSIVRCVLSPASSAAPRDRPSTQAPNTASAAAAASSSAVVRVVHEDVEFGGVQIPKNTQLYGSLYAAHRDPRVFQDPDRFSIERQASPHLAFGGGIHFCIGAPLARLEGEIALGILARRLREPRLRTDPPAYRPAAVLRGPEALEIDLAGIAPAGS